MTTIENLRRSITDQQREILSRIWGYFREHKEWIPTRLLHHHFGGKAQVRPALEQLGGSIVVVCEQTSTKYYQLTLLGVLLTDEGQYWQEFLAGYLRYLSKVLAKDPLRTRVNSHEISDVLNLKPDQSMIFGELARFSSHFSRGGSFEPQQWEIEIPDSVEDLPDDLEQYISQIALKDYDPNTPLSAEEKLTHQIAQFQQGVKAMSKKKIFIVHGHAKNVRAGVVEFVNRLGLEPIVLEEKADKGRTVIEKFEDHANEVGYAIVLLTPDDLGGAKSEIRSVHDLKPRARQNVIFELGFFYGKLSRRQVCALLKGGVDIPSNLGGVLTVEMDKAGNWQHRLLTEIRAAGLVTPTESEMLSKPGLSFKLLSVSDNSPHEEIHLEQGSRGEHGFGFVLENTSKTISVVSDIQIRVEVGWNGDIPTHAIEIVRKVGRGRVADDGWIISIPTLRSVHAAELKYDGSNKSFIVRHPERWAGFYVRINDDRLRGELNLDYVVTCLKPEFWQTQGVLRLRFS